ncbi:MAG: polysaccharide biosynthesis protein [Flavobacteriaceae bacterium]
MKRKILITGAAGSIGSEITLPMQDYVLVDRDEFGLFQLMHKFIERTDICFELADVQDEYRMKQIIKSHKPDLIIHAAAYKQLPFLEEFPYEAYTNNSLATINLVRWAEELKVPEFIYISTDKAVNPISHLGKSKRLGEEFVLSSKSAMKRKVIRFGNVIYSRGAVQESFEMQLKKQGYIELTDEQMQRYFLTSNQLVKGMRELVNLEEEGLFIMKMGAPKMILDFAKEFLLSKGYSDDAIKIIGVRPGEKLSEDLHFENEIFIKSFDSLNLYESPLIEFDEGKVHELIKNYLK